MQSKWKAALSILLTAISTMAFSGAHASNLIPSQLDNDSAHFKQREKAFTEWTSLEEASAQWNQRKETDIPLYKEVKFGDENTVRYLYIPNPGTTCWVLPSLDEEAFWATNTEKTKEGALLISAVITTDSHGNKNYWALWIPRGNAPLLQQKMKDFGILPAEIRPSTVEHLQGLLPGASSHRQLALVILVGIHALMLLFVILIWRHIRRIARALRYGHLQASSPESTEETRGGWRLEK